MPEPLNDQISHHMGIIGRLLLARDTSCAMQLFRRIAASGNGHDVAPQAFEAGEGGYVQFAAPLMWSHVEYARALLVRAKDWWKV